MPVRMLPGGMYVRYTLADPKLPHQIRVVSQEQRCRVGCNCLGDGEGVIIPWLDSDHWAAYNSLPHRSTRGVFVPHGQNEDRDGRHEAC